MGKKEMLASLLSATGVTALGARRRGRRGGMLSILAYHRVLDIGPEDAFAHDPELVSASPAEFEWQMRALLRHYRPVRLGDALRDLERGKALVPGAVAITFDDGHRDNYEHAFPILARLGIPATIFLATGYIDRPGTFWFDEVAALLYRSPHASIRLRGLDLNLELGGVSRRRAASQILLARLKQVPDAQRRAALGELRSESGVVDAVDDGSGALSWKQVMEMRDGGIEFGSHTVSHPILSRVDEADLHAELAGSKRELEARLGVPVALLAYPVGGESAYDDRVVRVARQCGYRLALTYVPGVARWPPSDPFALPRLHVERYTTRARFEAMLAFPRLFA